MNSLGYIVVMLTVIINWVAKKVFNDNLGKIALANEIVLDFLQ